MLGWLDDTHFAAIMDGVALDGILQFYAGKPI